MNSPSVSSHATSFGRILFCAGALVLLAVLALFFRTYSLHGGPALIFRSSEGLAREAVDRRLGAQIRATLEKNLPELPTEERRKMAELQSQRLKVEDRSNYEAVVKKTVQNMDKMRSGEGYRYLLEADAYYFLLQTKKLLEKGRIAESYQGGRYMETSMRGPHGHWTVILLHPYVGFYWYKLISFFLPGADLMRTLGTLSLFLTLLILPLFMIFGRVLRIPSGAGLLGAATIVLSPIFIQRSALGWYDTDPYSYLFPISILAFVFQGLKGPKWFWLGVFGAAFMTALYALFWPGWAFIAVLLPFCLLGSVSILWFFDGAPGSEIIRNAIRFIFCYIMGALIFLAVFLTKEGLAESIRMGWFALNKFALADFDVWPNIFLSVGEAGSVSFIKLIFLTGNYVTFGLAVIGLVWEGLAAFRERDFWPRFRYLFFVFFGAPVFLMALRTQRFSILFVLPLAIFVSFAVTRFVPWFNGVLGRFFLKRGGGNGLTRVVSWLSISLFYAPLVLISAHVVAMGIKPIMDDVWYAAMTELEAKTPQNAIIDSWWPPGYFISGVARRRVVADGGTQHFRTSYWMAKTFMTQDEREASGILRMLNTDMEDGPDLLEKWGMKASDIAPLILRIVRVDRSTAFSLLPAFLTESQKQTLLDKTHGKGNLPPSFLLVYNDLVDQNLALSVTANWDFEKAESLHRERIRGQKGPGKLFGMNLSQRYLADLRRVTGKWFRYTSPSRLIRREGDILFFENGVRVNWRTKESMIFNAVGKVAGTPASLFFMEGDKLVEKVPAMRIFEVSVLVTEEEGVFYAVVADAELIRSLLFRLYYFKGAGLSLFKPLFSRGTLAGGTVVRVFELDRAQLRDRSASA